jgi:hypothetical protein
VSGSASPPALLQADAWQAVSALLFPLLLATLVALAGMFLVAFLVRRDDMRHYLFVRHLDSIRRPP